MKIFAKIRWVVSILLVFFIVLITNLIDKENFDRLSYSVTTMYEDKITAKDLILDMTRIIHKKEIALVSSDSESLEKDYEISNRKIENLLLKYQDTKLTEREEFLFEELKKDFEIIRNIEKNYVPDNKVKMHDAIDRIKEDLIELSEIQIKESKRQLFISKKAMDTIKLFTQGEIIFLIIMAILVQIIILYKPKKIAEEELSDK